MVSVPRKCFSMALEGNKTTLSVHRQFSPFLRNSFRNKHVVFVVVVCFVIIFFLNLSENYLDIVARL